jgi:UDP-hydrolysing UDP-N-acetyl-D-glucosamine 2-epimerase
MKKLLVVVNNRANYARIKTVLIEANKSKKIQLIIVVAASGILDRYGDVVKMMIKDGLKASYKINTIVEGQSLNTMAKSTALSILELSTIFDQCKPDIVFTIADRFETIAAAIAGSYMNIIVAHSQGGEVTGSIDESVRHSITKLAHIHFPSTKKSFDRLIRLGEERKRIFLTGCPAMDLAYKTDKKITQNFIKKYQGVGYRVDYRKPYITVLQHPNTLEFGEGLNQINETLKAMSKIEKQIVWIWPNIDAGSNEISKGLRMFREKNENKNKKFCFVKNFTPEDYIKLLYNSSCVVGNSSSTIRECSALGVPSVCVGTRQSGRESGHNVLFSKYNSKEIYNKTLFQIKHGKYRPQKIFGDGSAGKKIVKAIEKFNINIHKKLTY